MLELKIAAETADELRARLAQVLDSPKYNNAALQQHVNILSARNARMLAIINFLDHMNPGPKFLDQETTELLEFIRRHRG